MGRKRYCSVACRQRLRRKLDQRTGLLKALNTRYAAFYFTDHVIILDILPFGASEISSFFFPRSPDQPPADDFSRLSNLLGNRWWREKKATDKSYLASRQVLASSGRGELPSDSLKPKEISVPSVTRRPLILLQLNAETLKTRECQAHIKRSYRKQVLRCHPDHGGSSEDFMEIRNAYLELLDWADHPTFIRRRGFVDKWFYDGGRNRWVQPLPEPENG